MHAKGQRKIILSIAIIGLMCVMLVVLSAYAAELKVNNNAIEISNSLLQDEIDTLGVKIKSANSIDHIEEVAINQLGMVYANDSECVYLSRTEKPTSSLAVIIRENAYN